MFPAKVLVPGQLLPEQPGDLQRIGTVRGTAAAAGAVPDLLHFSLPLGRQVRLVGRAGHQQRDAGGVGDLDALGTGHTVAAAAAEIPAERSLFLGGQPLHLLIPAGRVFLQRQPLPQLRHPLDAVDRHHLRVLPQKGEGDRRVADQTAGHRLHGDKADIQLGRALHQGDLPLPGQHRKGILQRIVKAAFQRLLRYRDPVGGESNVPDRPGLFLPEQPVINAILLAGTVHLGGAVQLVDIDIVGFQHPQALLQAALHRLDITGRGLGGDHNILAHIAQGLPQLILTVGVGVGGIVKVHAGLVGGPQDGGGFRLRDALDGQRAKGGAADGKAGAAQTGILHFYLLF